MLLFFGGMLRCSVVCCCFFCMLRFFYCMLCFWGVSCFLWCGSVYVFVFVRCVLWYVFIFSFFAVCHRCVFRDKLEDNAHATHTTRVTRHMRHRQHARHRTHMVRIQTSRYHGSLVCEVTGGRNGGGEWEMVVKMSGRPWRRGQWKSFTVLELKLSVGK